MFEIFDILNRLYNPQPRLQHAQPTVRPLDLWPHSIIRSPSVIGFQTYHIVIIGYSIGT